MCKGSDLVLIDGALRTIAPGCAENFTVFLFTDHPASQGAACVADLPGQ